MDTPPLKQYENSLYTVRRNDYFNERHYGTRYYKNNALGSFWILVLHSYIFSGIFFFFFFNNVAFGSKYLHDTQHCSSCLQGL